jgi:hypothetical protein
VSHAATGADTHAAVRRTTLAFTTVEKTSGKPQSNVPSGLATTRSGAAMSIMISCCVMCAAKETEVSASSGGPSAAASPTHPNQKHAARVACSPRERRARRHWPTVYATATISSNETLTGSMANAPPGCA